MTLLCDYYQPLDRRTISQLETSESACDHRMMDDSESWCRRWKVVKCRRISRKSVHVTHVQRQVYVACGPGSDIRGSFSWISRRHATTGDVRIFSSPQADAQHRAFGNALICSHNLPDAPKSSKIRQLFVRDFTFMYRQISEGISTRLFTPDQ